MESSNYQLICANCPEDLCKMSNDMITKGYKPLGGPFVVTNDTDSKTGKGFYQAFIK